MYLPRSEIKETTTGDRILKIMKRSMYIAVITGNTNVLTFQFLVVHSCSFRRIKSSQLF